MKLKGIQKVWAIALGSLLWLSLLPGFQADSWVWAQTVDIEGEVRLEAARRSVARQPVGGYETGSAGGGFAQSDTTADDILIWLVDRNSAADYSSRREGLRILDQDDKRFRPRMMAVMVGDTVRITNSDPVYHNVFSLSKTKRFDVGRRSPDDYQDVVFNRPGVVDVFCDIHSNMHAVIRVLPRQTVAWQKLSSEGHFVFENIPEGTYTVHYLAMGDRKSQLDISAMGTRKIILKTVRLGGNL